MDLLIVGHLRRCQMSNLKDLVVNIGVDSDDLSIEPVDSQRSLVCLTTFVCNSVGTHREYQDSCGIRRENYIKEGSPEP